MKLYAATGNPGKLREFRAAAQGTTVEILPLPDSTASPPCPETGDSFEANAVLKATCYGARLRTGRLFADDSGLELEALGGAPGLLSARFAGPQATDEANNLLLVERMRGISNRAARFVCVIALVEDGRLVHLFHGSVPGLILDAPRGSAGFGYDPLFFYPPLGRSFGELSLEEKLAVSHRGQALRALLGSF